MKLLRGASFELAKTLRPDLGERVFWLGRRELCRVYGRHVVRFAMRQIRSLVELEPVRREEYLLARRRLVLSNERTMLERRLASIDLKSRVRGATPELRRARDALHERVENV